MGQQPVWMVIALVLDAVIAVTGILIGGSFNLTGLLAVGPLLACARCNGRMTALVAGWALALYAVVAVVTGTTRTTLEGYRFGTVAVAGALATFAATVRSRREGALITISESPARDPAPAARRTRRHGLRLALPVGHHPGSRRR